MAGRTPVPGEEAEERRPLWHWPLIVAIVAGAPLLCRIGNLAMPHRCLVVILVLLALNLSEVMPLYCQALFVPVLGTICAVLGEEHGMEATATRLVAQIFNSTSSLILGALVINGIFLKCGVVERMLYHLLRRVPLDSAAGLLLVMLGTAAGSSILYSCSIMMLTALKPFLEELEDESIVKRILLSIAFMSNLGSTWLPISSPVNLISISLLRQFDELVSPYRWAAVAMPISLLTIICTWCFFLVFFPSKERSPEETRRLLMLQRQKSVNELSAGAGERHSQEMTRTHYFFMSVSVLAVLAITIWDGDKVEPLLGHPAMISLSVVVLAFGSGFLSREDFLALDWDLLMVVGGTNVVAFLVRETGLAKALSDSLVSIEVFMHSPFCFVLVLLISSLVIVSTLLGHTVTGVILLPLVVAVGVKLNATKTVCILSAVAIPMGMGLPTSSFDNLASFMASKSLGKRKFALTQRDFRFAGLFTALVGTVAILLLGSEICRGFYGSPPPVRAAKALTPEALVPRNETTPEEALGLNTSREEVSGHPRHPHRQRKHHHTAPEQEEPVTRTRRTGDGIVVKHPEVEHFPALVAEPISVHAGIPYPDFTHYPEQATGLVLARGSVLQSLLEKSPWQPRAAHLTEARAASFLAREVRDGWGRGVL